MRYAISCRAHCSLYRQVIRPSQRHLRVRQSTVLFAVSHTILLLILQRCLLYIPCLFAWLMKPHPHPDLVTLSTLGALIQSIIVTQQRPATQPEYLEYLEIARKLVVGKRAAKPCASVCHCAYANHELSAYGKNRGRQRFDRSGRPPYVPSYPIPLRHNQLCQNGGGGRWRVELPERMIYLNTSGVRSFTAFAFAISP